MYTLYYRWKDRRTDEKINNAYMKFIIEPGTSTDIDELEKLYNELNDYLAATMDKRFLSNSGGCSCRCE